jgi:hypothetical protein
MAKRTVKRAKPAVKRTTRTAKRTKRATPRARRTTHRSKSGTKLYAVRDKKGRFKDIQTYKRAHGADIKRKSKAEKRKKR